MPRQDDVQNLLTQLNELERLYGRVPAEKDPNYDPSGEANARIHLLKQKLESLGAELEWDGSQYRLRHIRGRGTDTSCP